MSHLDESSECATALQHTRGSLLSNRENTLWTGCWCTPSVPPSKHKKKPPKWTSHQRGTSMSHQCHVLNLVLEQLHVDRHWLPLMIGLDASNVRRNLCVQQRDHFLHRGGERTPGGRRTFRCTSPRCFVAFREGTFKHGILRLEHEPAQILVKRVGIFA